MSKETKLLYQSEILSALVGLLFNFAVIALVISVIWYLYTIVAYDFTPGFLELSRNGGNTF